MTKKGQTTSMPTSAKKFSMAFKDFRIFHLSFDVDEAFQVGDDGVYEHDIQTDIGYNYHDERRALAVSMGVYITGKNSPYTLTVKGAGLFIFKDTPDPKLINVLAKINCPAIVFPYLRETVADITRRAGFQPLHLQPVNFVKLARETETKKKPAPKKSKGKKSTAKIKK